jgi:hypothetical protein
MTVETFLGKRLLNVVGEFPLFFLSSIANYFDKYLYKCLQRFV